MQGPFWTCTTLKVLSMNKDWEWEISILLTTFGEAHVLILFRGLRKTSCISMSDNIYSYIFWNEIPCVLDVQNDKKFQYV